MKVLVAKSPQVILGFMQKAYFISDVHLAVKVKEKEAQRRKELFALLDQVRDEGAALIIVGDFFDFYFEWGSVVSRSFVDVFTKLRELRDAGTEIHYYAGNHDFWLGPFLSEDLGIHIHLEPSWLDIGGARFYCIHGDGLAKDDVAYRRFRRIIRSPISTWLFKWFIHPNLAHWIAQQVSYQSRQMTHTELRLIHAAVAETAQHTCRHSDTAFPVGADPAQALLSAHNGRRRAV